MLPKLEEKTIRKVKKNKNNFIMLWEINSP